MEARKSVLSAEKGGDSSPPSTDKPNRPFSFTCEAILGHFLSVYKFSFTSGIQRKETFMILFNPPHGFLLNLQIALKRRF
jgi:hypothetical protein